MSSQPFPGDGSPMHASNHFFFFEQALNGAVDEPLGDISWAVESELEKELNILVSCGSTMEIDTDSIEDIDSGSLVSSDDHNEQAHESSSFAFEFDQPGAFPSHEFMTLLTDLSSAAWTVDHAINKLRLATGRGFVVLLEAPGYIFFPTVPDLTQTAKVTQHVIEEWAEAVRREAETLINETAAAGVETLDLPTQELFDDLRNDLDTLILHLDVLRKYVEQELEEQTSPDNYGSATSEPPRRTCADDQRRDCFGQSGRA